MRRALGGRLTRGQTDKTGRESFPSYDNIPNGLTTNYGYDGRNHAFGATCPQAAIEHKDGANVLDGFTYALDDVGNITQTTHKDGSFWDYVYDGRYRLTSAVRKNANETIEANYAYTYDAGDNLLTKVEPFEDDFNDGNYTGWSAWSGTWSAANNYLRMTPGSAATIAKTNTDNDNEVRFSYVCNDTSNAGYTLTVSPRYASSGDRIYVNILPGSINLAQRVSGVWSSLDTSATSSTQGTEYTIRVVCDGQNVQVFRTAPGALEEEIVSTSSCTVASTNYLSFTPSANADYSIDNIRILSDDLSNTTTFAVNNANELTSMTDYNGSTTFGFDAWGRMTSKARGSYAATYGYRYGQMLRSHTSDFPGEGDVTYEYGGNGRKRSETADTTTSYRWRGQSLINIEDAYGNLQVTDIGLLASVSGSAPASGMWQFQQRDYLDSARYGTDVSKNPLMKQEFSPYGGEFVQHGTSSYLNYAHLHEVSGSPIHHSLTRTYYPELGRWMQRDPLNMVDGPNLYSYVANDPVNATDPTGLCREANESFWDCVERWRNDEDDWKRMTGESPFPVADETAWWINLGAQVCGGAGMKAIGIGCTIAGGVIPRFGQPSINAMAACMLPCDMDGKGRLPNLSDLLGKLGKVVHSKSNDLLNSNKHPVVVGGGRDIPRGPDDWFDELIY